MSTDTSLEDNIPWEERLDKLVDKINFACELLINDGTHPLIRNMDDIDDEICMIIEDSSAQLQILKALQPLAQAIIQKSESLHQDAWSCSREDSYYRQALSNLSQHLIDAALLADIYLDILQDICLEKTPAEDLAEAAPLFKTIVTACKLCLRVKTLLALLTNECITNGTEYVASYLYYSHFNEQSILLTTCTMAISVGKLLLIFDKCPEEFKDELVELKEVFNTDFAIDLTAEIGNTLKASLEGEQLSTPQSEIFYIFAHAVDTLNDLHSEGNEAYGRLLENKLEIIVPLVETCIYLGEERFLRPSSLADEASRHLVSPFSKLIAVVIADIHIGALKESPGGVPLREHLLQASLALFRNACRNPESETAPLLGFLAYLGAVTVGLWTLRCDFAPFPSFLQPEFMRALDVMTQSLRYFYCGPLWLAQTIRPSPHDLLELYFEMFQVVLSRAPSTPAAYSAENMHRMLLKFDFIFKYLEHVGALAACFPEIAELEHYDNETARPLVAVVNSLWPYLLLIRGQGEVLHATEESRGPEWREKSLDAFHAWKRATLRLAQAPQEMWQCADWEEEVIPTASSDAEPSLVSKVFTAAFGGLSSFLAILVPISYYDETVRAFEPHHKRQIAAALLELLEVCAAVPQIYHSDALSVVAIEIANIMSDFLCVFKPVLLPRDEPKLLALQKMCLAFDEESSMTRARHTVPIQRESPFEVAFPFTTNTIHYITHMNESQIKKARIKRMAALRTQPCAYVGCMNFPPPGKKSLNSRKCSKCRWVRYCSKGCQAKDWKEHQKVCAIVYEQSDNIP